VLDAGSRVRLEADDFDIYNLSVVPQK